MYPVGCAGVITHAERLPDGRSNVVLRGLEKFRIVSEDHSRAYRVAHRRPAARNDERRRHGRCCASSGSGSRPCSSPPSSAAAPTRSFPPAIADDDLVNALAQYLSLDPVERQALLERDGILARCHGLIELLEMKTFPVRLGQGSGVH